jgi:hypothetical protein
MAGCRCTASKKTVARDLDEEGVFHGLGVEGRLFAVEQGQGSDGCPVGADVHQHALLLDEEADGPFLDEQEPVHLACSPVAAGECRRQKIDKAASGDAGQALPVQFGKGQGAFEEGDDAVVSRRLNSRVHGVVLEERGQSPGPGNGLVIHRRACSARDAHAFDHFLHGGRRGLGDQETPNVTAKLRTMPTVPMPSGLMPKNQGDTPMNLVCTM